MPKNYNDYIEQVSSEKIILAHIHCKWRAFTFTTYSGNIHQKTMDYFVSAVKQDSTELTQAADRDSVTSGKYYFDITTNILYVYSTDISSSEVIVTFRLFFSNAPISLSNDMTDSGEEVCYEPRIKTTSGIDVKINEELRGLALIGNGKLTLEASDGYFDNIFEKYIFENKSVIIYSYSRDILPSEAQVIYRGVINTKILDNTKAIFTLKDYLKLLEKSVASTRFESSDNVTDDVIDNFKRRVFGRVNGMKLQSTDMSDEETILTGTLSSTGGSTAITGSGSNFLDELTPGDTLVISDTEYSIESIASDTSLTLSEESGTTNIDIAIVVKFDQPYQGFNRKYIISPIVLSEPSSDYVSTVSTTIFIVDDVSKFKVGDYIDVDTSPSQRRLISRIISSGNKIVISTAFDTIPTNINSICRSPVQAVYYDKRLVPATYYSITNTIGDGCFITFTATFERDLAVTELLSDKNYEKDADDTRRVYYDTLGSEQPSVKIKPRDWVKFAASGWLEVLSTDSDDIILLRDHTNTTAYSGVLKIKRTNVLHDDSIVSADIYGETEDSTADGTWIFAASQLYKLILTEAGYSDLLDTNSFDSDETAIIGVVTPEDLSKESETIKNLIVRVNNSTHSVLTVNNRLKFKYLNFDASIDYDNITAITDFDIIKWKIKQNSPKLYSDFSISYNYKEIDYISEDSLESIYALENEFVDTYVGVEKTLSADYHLYNLASISEIVQRQSFLSTLTASTYTITSDLRYQDLEIGDTVRLDFLSVKGYSGDSTNKICIVIGVSKKNDGVILTVTDLGQIYTRRCVITPDTAPDYSVATDNEKLIYGFITEDTGLQDNNEDTNGRDLIF